MSIRWCVPIFHGNMTQQKQKICHGKTRNFTEGKKLHSEPDALATVATLRRRIQLFIAYLYKPEAQAKVLQIPVYYSDIIPSLALQACKAKKRRVALR